MCNDVDDQQWLSRSSTDPHRKWTIISHGLTDSSGGPEAKTPSSQWRGGGFGRWSGNWIPKAATERLQAATKTADPPCYS